LTKFTLPVLKELCQRTGATTSGSKKELVGRLAEPAEPVLLAQRKRQDQYVPRDRTAAHAILCALERSERNGADGGIDKDRVLRLGERTGVSPKSLYEKVGPMGYDGWSCAKDLLTKGEPPLCKRLKGGLYTLTRFAGVSVNEKGDRVTCDSGRDVATALHCKAHLRNWCTCGDPPPASAVTRRPGLDDVAPSLDDDDLNDLNDDAPSSSARQREKKNSDIRAWASPPKAPRPTAKAATPPTATAIRKRPPRRDPPPLTGDKDFDDLWDRPPVTTSSPASSADSSIVDLTASPAKAPTTPPAKKRPSVVVVDLTGDSP